MILQIFVHYHIVGHYKIVKTVEITIFNIFTIFFHDFVDFCTLSYCRAFSTVEGKKMTIDNYKLDPLYISAWEALAAELLDKDFDSSIDWGELLSMMRTIRDEAKERIILASIKSDMATDWNQVRQDLLKEKSQLNRAIKNLEKTIRLLDSDCVDVIKEFEDKIAEHEARIAQILSEIENCKDNKTVFGRVKLHADMVKMDRSSGDIRVATRPSRGTKRPIVVPTADRAGTYRKYNSNPSSPSSYVSVK